MNRLIHWLKEQGLISSPRSVAEWVLLGANLIPLVGITLLGWDAVSLLFIYWAESLIIGFYFLIKMGLSTGKLSLFFVPFFTVHYGGFMFGHLAFLTLFADAAPAGGIAKAMIDYDKTDWPGAFTHLGTALFFARYSLVPLVVSHGTSFVQNFLGRGEYKELRKSFRISKSMSEEEKARNQASQGGAILWMIGSPYLRIVLMHVTIIIAALPVMLFGSPWPALFLLVLLKTAIDWMVHRFMHRNSYEDESSRQGRNLLAAAAIVLMLLLVFHFFM